MKRTFCSLALLGVLALTNLNLLIVQWVANGPYDGVIFYRIQTEGFAQTRKLLLLK